MKVLVIANTTAWATSCGVPIRRAGLLPDRRAKSSDFPSSPSPSQAPVSMVPGDTALTRIGASSTASDRVTVLTEPLVAATPRKPGSGSRAATPENRTKDPSSGMRGAKCLASMIGPTTLVWKDRMIASGVSSLTFPRARADAVETTWSTLPRSSASAAIVPSSVRSTRRTVTSVPL